MANNGPLQIIQGQSGRRCYWRSNLKRSGFRSNHENHPEFDSFSIGGTNSIGNAKDFRQICKPRITGATFASGNTCCGLVIENRSGVDLQSTEALLPVAPILGIGRSVAPGFCDAIFLDPQPEKAPIAAKATAPGIIQRSPPKASMSTAARNAIGTPSESHQKRN